MVGLVGNIAAKVASNDDKELQQDVVDCLSQAMEKFTVEKDIAAAVKKDMDKKVPGTWHVE